jgi:hypothetical protein
MTKKILFMLLFLCLVTYCWAEQPDSLNTSGNPIDKENCTYKETPLYGKVKIVSAFADFDVKIVESFPDLKVKSVNAFADECGEWQFVDAFPDFTIRIVDAFPDFTIKMVNSFPGMP